MPSSSPSATSPPGGAADAVGDAGSRTEPAKP
jgi:hypothetical protein